MVNPQKERGYVGIANEIWDEIIRRDFTKRQKDILLFILRLSYGCNRKVASIPKQKDFELCGVGQGHIKAELNYLIQCKVIVCLKEKKEYRLNKHYDHWKVPPVQGWDYEKFKYLIHINLQDAKKDRSEVTETVTFPLQEKMEFNPEILTETVIFNKENIHMETYRNSNFEEGKNLPNQEVEENGDLTETVTFENKNLLKR